MQSDEQPPHLPSAEDQHPAGAHRFVGRAIAFDDPTGGVPPVRLVGIVEDARYIGLTARGAIPDYEITVRGKSGRVVKVSLVESYATFTDAP